MLPQGTLTQAYQQPIRELQWGVGRFKVGLSAYSSAEPRRINDFKADLRGFYFLTSIPYQHLTILIHCDGSHI